MGQREAQPPTEHLGMGSVPPQHSGVPEDTSLERFSPPLRHDFLPSKMKSSQDRFLFFFCIWMVWGQFPLPHSKSLLSCGSIPGLK